VSQRKAGAAVVGFRREQTKQFGFAKRRMRPVELLPDERRLRHQLASFPGVVAR